MKTGGPTWTTSSAAKYCNWIGVGTGASQRELARRIGCSEGLVRHLLIVAHLPMLFKERIRAGEPTRKFVAWAGANRRAQRGS